MSNGSLTVLLSGGMKKMRPRGSRVICPSSTILCGRSCTPLVPVPFTTFSWLRTDSVTVVPDGRRGSFEKTRISLSIILLTQPSFQLHYQCTHLMLAGKFPCPITLFEKGDHGETSSHQANHASYERIHLRIFPCT